MIDYNISNFVFGIYGKGIMKIEPVNAFIITIKMEFKFFILFAWFDLKQKQILQRQNWSCSLCSFTI